MTLEDSPIEDPCTQGEFNMNSEVADPEMFGTATYSPEDNKLRFYPFSRLDKELYDRVRASGFIWAPRQELFVAPAWTPNREDFLIYLCGEIGDEDTSLVDRAEERAERFGEYQDNRQRDAESAARTVDYIADGIPFGQPILVGHHSEKRARKDADKIHDGMRKQIKMWETARYWQDRAAGALRHAKYLERSDVRYRRIKKLESEIRVMRASFTPDPKMGSIMQQAYTRDYQPDAPPVKHVWCGLARGGHWVQETSLPAIERHYSRWIAHNENRIAYEKAMLGESGGLVSEKVEFQIGGQVLVGSEWCVIIRINRKAGEILSLRTTRRYCPVVGIEEVKEYKEPEAGLAEKIKEATKLPPLVNFRSEGCFERTKADYDSSVNCGSACTRRIAATEEHRAYRQRTLMRVGRTVNVFITDMPVKERPAVTLIEKPTFSEVIKPMLLELPIVPRREWSGPDPLDAKIDQLKQASKAGVTVVSAPQLFPTPEDLAARMVNEADLEPGMTILEPSAGTGRILDAILAADLISGYSNPTDIIAVEINATLSNALMSRYNGVNVLTMDFLDYPVAEPFADRILMNPPFKNGSDIKHVRHAIELLKPGGRLIAIMAGGTRQQDYLKTLDEDVWFESLPAGTFAESGTNVRTLLVCYDKPR